MILRRYAEVAAALRDPTYEIVGGAADESSHRAMREQARLLYRPPKWPDIEFPASEMEFVRDVAEPWSVALAASVTKLEVGVASRLVPAARIVFDLGEGVQEATQTLAAHFDALHVQAFVALTVSLPAFLGNALLALLEHPDQFEFINERGAVDELLRFAGPSIKQMRIRNGETVELMLAEANRDPDVFPNPDALDLRRDAAGHLAFGAGPHACVGAPLIKSATAALLPELKTRFTHAQLIDAQPYGGSSIRGHRVFVR